MWFRNEPKKENPCIQKRIKEKAKKVLLELLSHPVWLFIFCFIMFLLPTFLYINALETLDYDRASDIVELLVRTDGVLIAFSGVIASIILRKFFEESHRAKVRLSKAYKEKRDRIISFIGAILLILISSIFFGLWAILLQNFVFTIFFSVVLLFTGIIELFAMLVYAVRFDPEQTNRIRYQTTF